MTKRLKRKVKRISLALIIAIVLAVLALANASTTLFGMAKDKEKDLNAAETAETENSANNGIMTFADDGVIACDSIMQGVKDNDLPDGNYTFRVNGKTDAGSETIDYKIELINYKDDVVYSPDAGNQNKTILLGDTSKEYKMLVVKYHKNLTIDKGVTVTAATSSTTVSGANYNLCYKKGMYICVLGELTNNGTISMTARGTYNVAGENVYLWKDKNSNFEYIPASGVAGLPAIQPSKTIGSWSDGKKGNNGTNRRTGSGGQGGNMYNSISPTPNGWMGASTAGTSYAGGNGTGGATVANTIAIPASYTQASKNIGGNGYAYNSGGSGTRFFAGGGAGILGGNSSYYNISSGLAGTEAKGHVGTGGLLLLYTDTLSNNGTIEANGSAGAGAWTSFNARDYNGATGGGGSGGGSVNVFYKKSENLGNIIADRWTRSEILQNVQV